MSYDFKAYPKIPRLNKLVWSITEKLDGTNGIVHFTPVQPTQSELADSCADALVAGAVAIVRNKDGDAYACFAGSRSRWLNPAEKQGDNYGFGAFVAKFAQELFDDLGPGTHYGEWWGNGIQRGYNQPGKRFTLFNPWRYPDLPEAGSADDAGYWAKVPLLATGTFDSSDAALSLRSALIFAGEGLKGDGSRAAPGFPNPEGFVLTIGDQKFKVILNEGDKAKSRDGA